MKKIKAPKKSKSTPKKKKDLSKLVKVKVRIKKGKRAGQFMVVYKKRSDVKPDDIVEKKEAQSQPEKPEKEERAEKTRFEPKKTLDLQAYDYESSEPVISDFKQDKSLMSPFYYQVPFVQDGQRKWKLYPNAGAYHRDFPNGPQEGHLLVNQAHPDHLEVNPNAVFATVGKKKFKTAEEFLKHVRVPSPAELKAMFRGRADSDKKGFKGTITPDFHHIEWQPGSKIFNANQRFWMGVQDEYTKYREPMQMKYDRERFARAGVPWTENDYRIRKEIVEQSGLGLTGAEQQAKASGAKKRKERLFSNPKANSPIKNMAELERIKDQSSIKNNTPVDFILNGKVYTGKVIHSAAFNAEGQQLKNKKSTHFKVEYNVNQHTQKKGGALKEITLTREQLQRHGTKPVRRKPKGQVAEEREKRQKDAEIGLLESAKKRLGATSDPDFQKKVLDILAGEHGLGSPQNPINRFLEMKVEKIVGNWAARGTVSAMRGPDGRLYISDMSHSDLVHAARVGVFDAITKYDPKKGKLIQFIGSNSTEYFVKLALKDALAMERGTIHKMDAEGRRYIAKLKETQEELHKLLERKPTYKEIEESFTHYFPQDAQRLAERNSYTIPKLIDLLHTSRVSPYIVASGDDMAGEIDLIEQAHSPFKSPEAVAIEKVQMGEFRKNLYHTLKDSYEKSGHKNPEKQALLASHAMQLRHRVDESTTGYGTFGEESPYYKEATPKTAKMYEDKYRNKTSYAGAVHIDGVPHQSMRTHKEVAAVLGKTPKQIEQVIDDATNRVRTQFDAGHQSAVDLKKQFFGKSYRQLSDEIHSYMLKSLFPEKRDIYAEKQWKQAHQMAVAIFLAA